MAVTRLLHFIPDSGICRNQKPHKQFKYSIRRDNLDLSIDHASLLSSKLTDCVKRPIFSSRYNVLKCRSSLSPDSNVTKSCMQTATMALRGPNNSLLGSPAANLVVAIGVIVFALCGLKPILRGGRKAFLHKDENSWKRSTTRHILISYLEPILLWGGAMLICRALDPVVMPTKAGRLVKIRIITFVRSLSTVLTFAYCISCAVQRAHTVFVETTEHSDAGSMGFNLAGKAVYTSVWIASISLFLELLGFSTKKWLTAGGLGTVLLTLAGREIFTNFLSSVLIQATRPFVVNEWIQTNIEGYEVSGTVEDVGWWSPTLIRGEDREAVYIPNHKFTVNIVRNLSQKTHWRIRASISISHLDVNKIHAIVADMRKVLAKNPQVEQQKLHRRVFFDNVNPENQALIILVSCFVKTSHHEEYQCVKEAILLDLLRVISHHRARLATPIRTVQNRYTDPDVDNIPFAESEYSDEVTANRPLLLINGEDFAKARLARSDVGQEDNRARGEQSSSDSVVDGKISGTEESAKSVTTTPDQGSRKPGLQPTTDSKTDSKLKEKSESQSRTGETSRSGTMASDQDSRVSVQQSKSDSKASKSGSPASAFAAKMEVKQPVISSASSQTKHIEISLPAELKPALEDNIVLEVALDGLKRGLPIDESAKEMATKRNSNEKDGSLTIKKVDKDN